MVSRKVSTVVSLEAVRQGRRNQSPPPPSGTPKSGKPRTPSPGPNLVRSQNIYLFQVRWPKHLDPARRAAPIRISLGACPHKEARRQADLLIGYARRLFGRAGQLGVTDDQPKKDGFSEYTDEELEAKLNDPNRKGELVGELRVYQKIISSPPPSDSPADQKMFAAMRGFVQLSKEISDPDNANPLVVDNFETLQTKYTRDLEAAFTEKDSAARTPDPREETARRARALAERTGISAGYGGSPEKPLDANVGVQPREGSQMVEAASTASKDREKPQHYGLGEASGDAADIPLHKKIDPPTETAAAPECILASPVQPAIMPGQPAAISDEHIPTYKLDRRFIERPASSAPLFSVVAKENLDAWEKRRATKSGKSTDVASARARCELFVELIGDHPADTYVPSDLQAFIELLRFYPAKMSDRRKGLTAREIISDNSDLQLKPLSSTTIRTQYVSTVKRIIAEGALGWEYKNPLENVSLRLPKGRKNNRKAKTSPLSSVQVSTIFRKGVESGLLDNAMLPLLGYLTGRRIGLLTYTSADDIIEKFPGVWVLQPKMEIVEEETGASAETPSKTEESEDYFVLHRILEDIGFIQWAVQQDGFIFKELMRLEDPARSASSYMGRLLTAAGVKTTNSRNREVFHSLRGGNIEELRQQFKDRETRLQVGHKGNKDNHDLYGFQLIPERLGRAIYNRELDTEVNFSVFEGLSFDLLSTSKRHRGRKRYIGG
ncbi:hypothetical protein ACVDG9_06000 [Roseibium sp. RP-7]